MLRVDDDTWEQLRTLSFTTRKSINQIVNEAIQKYLCDIKKEDWKMNIDELIQIVNESNMECEAKDEITDILEDWLDKHPNEGGFVFSREEHASCQVWITRPISHLRKFFLLY